MNTFNPPTEEEFNKTGSWGLLTSIDIYNCNLEKMQDEDAIREFTHILCDKIGVKRYGETQIVEFGEDPRVHGFSMVQLIETSLVSGHFADESKAVYLDVFSCKYYDANKIVEYAMEFFEGSNYKAHLILRD